MYIKSRSQYSDAVKERDKGEERTKKIKIKTEREERKTEHRRGEIIASWPVDDVTIKFS